MINEIESSIKEIAKASKSSESADEALKYTQSVLNLAHARSVIKDTDKRSASPESC